MARKFKKALSLSLALIMTLNLMNLSVFAEEAEVTYRCGKEEHTHVDACSGEQLICADETHEHEAACYETALICGCAEEHTHSEDCIPPSGESAADGGYYTRPINDNINLTLYNYGSYINVGPEKALQFGWHNNLYYPKNAGRPYEGIDGPAMKTDGTVFTTWPEIYYSNKIYNYPTVNRVLNEDGYPQISATQKVSTNRNSQEIVDVSLEYLFPKTGDALKVGAATNALTSYSKMRESATFIENNGFNSNYESMRFDMEGDGGLFEITEDGYYYYSCTKTSAYYDQEQNRFLLSDVLIGPGHDGAEYFRTSKNYARNFLPFNKIDFNNKDQFYQYSDTQWAYITDYAINSDAARNDLADLWFGFDMDFEFFMPKDGKTNGEDMTFTFQGDDDIWVYIDDVLVLDIGGCHGAVTGTINFATGEVSDPNVGYSNHDTNGVLAGTRNETTLKTLFQNALGDTFDESMFDGETFADYSKHEFKFFYTERGGNISYCALKFNMPTLPSDSLSVGKTIETTDGSEVPFITDALSYEFRVLKADAEGNATDELYIPAGTEFSVVSQDNYENVLGSGVVGEDGYFLLKDGQVALFEEVFTTFGNYEYVVEERIPEKFSGAYGEVEYTAGNASVKNEVKTEDGEAVEYLTYYTPALAADETQKVTFTNKIKVEMQNSGSGEIEGGGEEIVDPMFAPLTITKKESGSTLPDRQETYQFCVLAGYDSNLQPLSVGTKYTVDGVEKIVAKEGIIELKADETAELWFLEGTSYKVEEVIDTDYTYRVTYENAEGAIAIDDTKAIAATVTNEYIVPDAAVVLTVDMSGTMYRYKMDGKRYVEVAKAKALDFVTEYAKSYYETDDQRMLAIVAFDTDAKVVLNWVDVNTASGLATAKAAINGMKVADNGSTSSNQVCTNFDAGVILTRNILKQDAVKDIDKKFAIILSDGAPTVTVNNDTDTVGTIKSSFWGDQLDEWGTRYQIRRYGGGWTHPAEVARTLRYLGTGSNNLADLTVNYNTEDGTKEGIFIVGVGGDMSFKLFNDAVYGTSNGTRSADVKKNPAAFNNIDALAGYTQAEILKLTAGDWMGILADKVGGTYESAANSAALQAEFNNIIEVIKDVTNP